MNQTCDTYANANADAIDGGINNNKANAFFREGNKWHIRYEGQTTRLPHCKGFLYIAQLIRAPYKGVKCQNLGLETHESEMLRETAARKIMQDLGGDSIGEDGDLLQKLCDKKAKRDVEDELERLKLEVEHAKANHQVELAEILTDKIEKLEKYLADVGTSCRPRCFPSEAERARKRVANAIRRAIGAISRSHPALANHLQASLNLGGDCSYCPTVMTVWVV